MELEAVNNLLKEFEKDNIKLHIEHLDVFIEGFLFSVKRYPGLEYIMKDEQKRTKMLHFLVGIADYALQSLPKKDSIPSLGKYDKRLLSDSDLSDSDSVRLQILSSYFVKLLKFKPLEFSRAMRLQSTGGDVEEIKSTFIGFQKHLYQDYENRTNL